jgi:hypothetical protein
MFDLSALSEWDKAEQSIVPAIPVEAPREQRSIRTLQRIMSRDDQEQCPFGLKKELSNGQA